MGQDSTTTGGPRWRSEDPRHQVPKNGSCSLKFSGGFNFQYLSRQDYREGPSMELCASDLFARWLWERIARLGL